MPVIGKAMYEACEGWLREREARVAAAERRLRLARERAYDAHAAPMDKNGGSRSGRGDALERKAIAVQEAEEQLRQALRWDDAVTRTGRIYPPDTREGKVMRLLYERGMTQEDVCRSLHVERKTVRRCRDKIVINCALLAVQAGLMRMEEGPENEV